MKKAGYGSEIQCADPRIRIRKPIIFFNFEAALRKC
jgi:hypothetical protein